MANIKGVISALIFFTGKSFQGSGTFCKLLMGFLGAFSTGILKPSSLKLFLQPLIPYKEKKTDPANIPDQN